MTLTRKLLTVGILLLTAVLVVGNSYGAVFANKFTTNANPESVGWTNNTSAGISGNAPGLTNINTALGLDQSAVVFTKSGQNNQRRLPRVVFYFNQTETNTAGFLPCLTNLLTTIFSSGWYAALAPYGRPGVFFDYTWQETNFGPGGITLFNHVYFPSGVTNIWNVHSNGLDAILWCQDRPAGDPTASVGWSTLGLVMTNMAYVATNYGGDGAWWDSDTFSPSYYSTYLAAQAVSRIGHPFYLDVGAASGNELDRRLYQIASAVRPQPFGDPSTWSIQTNLWDYNFTNGLFGNVYPGGGSVNMNIVGFWVRTADENKSDVVMHAMTGSTMYYALGFTPNAMLTNEAFKQIYFDPLVAGCTRIITNGVWVMVKPLGTLAGPNYAVSIFNPSASSATPSVNWSAIGLPRSNYFVFDVTNPALNNRTDPGLCPVVTPTIASHGTAFYRLSIPIVAPKTATVSAQGGTAWTVTSHDNFDGPFGNGTFARNGFRTVMDSQKHVIWEVPDSARWVQINLQVGSTAVAWFTNQATAIRIDNTCTTAVDSGTLVYAVPTTNGVINVGYTVGFIPNTEGQDHWITESWNISTNTTAIIKLLEGSITYF